MKNQNVHSHCTPSCPGWIWLKGKYSKDTSGGDVELQDAMDMSGDDREQDAGPGGSNAEGGSQILQVFSDQRASSSFQSSSSLAPSKESDDYLPPKLKLLYVPDPQCKLEQAEVKKPGKSMTWMRTLISRQTYDALKANVHAQGFLWRTSEKSKLPSKVKVHIYEWVRVFIPCNPWALCLYWGCSFTLWPLPCLCLENTPWISCLGPTFALVSCKTSIISDKISCPMIVSLETNS